MDEEDRPKPPRRRKPVAETAPPSPPPTLAPTAPRPTRRRAPLADGTAAPNGDMPAAPVPKAMKL